MAFRTPQLTEGLFLLLFQLVLLHFSGYCDDCCCCCCPWTPQKNKINIAETVSDEFFFIVSLLTHLKIIPHTHTHAGPPILQPLTPDTGECSQLSFIADPSKRGLSLFPHQTLYIHNHKQRALEKPNQQLITPKNIASY
uniref:Putative secreted protein n=1 Tax=Anopheles marajoara TaxID=58244 RepID=A0A2M4C7N8_9DIPT